MLINIIIAFAAASVLSFLAMWYPWQGDGDGAIVLALLLWTEVTYEPPMVLELAIFLPLTVIVCAGSLRPLKALLIGLQYRHKAGQGRLKL